MRHGRTLSVLSGVAAVLTLTSWGVPAHAAAADVDGSISWTMRPSDGTAADGRTWVDIQADAGETIEEHAIVTNLSDVSADFRVTAADGFFTETGHFNMLPSNRPSTEAGTWVTLSRESVSLAAGESAVVSYTLKIPDNATPGDYAAGIAASVVSGTTSNDGAAMGVESRVGFRVMTQVTGELAPAIAIDDVEAAYQISWNLFEPGIVELAYTVRNSGNTRLITSTRESANGTLNPAVEAELLPGGTRDIAAKITNVWPLGFVTVQITSTGVVPTEAGIVPREQRRELFVWAIPVPQVLAIVGASLLIFALFWSRRRQETQVRKRIEAARTEAARTALARAGVDVGQS